MSNCTLTSNRIVRACAGEATDPECRWSRPGESAGKLAEEGAGVQGSSRLAIRVDKCCSHQSGEVVNSFSGL
jgi:hypothetical protein